MLDWCQKWTKSQPESALAWNNLGLAYRNLNRHNDAIEAYRQALRIDPAYSSAWNNRGNAYAVLMRYPDVIH